MELTDADGNKTSAIHEVYYNELTDRPMSYTVSPSMVICDGQDSCDLRWILDRMGDALSRPVLTETDFETNLA